MAIPCHFAASVSGMQLALKPVMHETRGDPIKRIVRLIETVHSGARVFASSAAASGAAPRLQRFAKELQKTAEQFEFELRTELTRLSAEPAPVTDSPNMDLHSGFELMLETYRDALGTSITAHTRARITRQFGEMLERYEELTSIHRAA
jgi:hypothetical protein